jgi:hypothetical protein
MRRLLFISAVCIVPMCGAGLIGSTVTGLLNFAGGATNSYDPTSGAVPTTGYQNSASSQNSPTVTILGGGNDFGQQGAADNDVTSFNNTGFTFTDTVLVGGGNSAIKLTVVDAAFTGLTLKLLSNNFPGLSYGIAGDVITVSIPQNAAVTTGEVLTASFSLVPTYYFSDLAFAGGWQTTLTYINYSPQAVTCVTNFYSDSGAPLSIPFSQGTVSTRTDTLQPGQSVHDQTVASLTATVEEGWAQASCTGPVQASVLYRLYTSGVPVGEASVSAETAATSVFVTFAQTATGVAYANPSASQSATIILEAYGSTGMPLGSHVITLGPLGHGSANVGPLLGLSSFTGFVKITSTIPIISVSLNAEAYPVFSSLPPGDLPGSTALVTP